MSNLGTVQAYVFGRLCSLFNWPIITMGVGPDGKPYPLAVNPDGTPAGAVRTPAIIIDTDGSHSPITAGKKSVAFLFSSDWTGTIQGEAVDATKFSQLGFDASGGDTLAAIAFTTTAGTVTILTLA